MEWISNSPEETLRYGQQLVRQFPSVQLICLKGPLGSGKTFLTKGIAQELGLNPVQIKSPTFTTLFEHSGPTRTLYHFDFYRQDPDQRFASDWWNEFLERPEALLVVEWPEHIAAHLPYARLEVQLTPLGELQRKLSLSLYESPGSS